MARDGVFLSGSSLGAFDVERCLRTIALADRDRCTVAPSPELSKRIKAELGRLAGTKRLQELAPTIKMAEPQAPGLNDGLIIPGSQFPLGTSIERVRSAAAERAPLRGTVRVVVVLVDFSDQQMGQPAAHFERAVLLDWGAAERERQGVLHGSNQRPGRPDRRSRRPLSYAADIGDVRARRVGPRRRRAERADDGTRCRRGQQRRRQLRALRQRRQRLSSTRSSSCTPGLAPSRPARAATSGRTSGSSLAGSTSPTATKIYALSHGAGGLAHRRVRARARPSAVRVPRPLRHRQHLGGHRQLVPDGGRQLERRRRHSGACLGVVQGQPGLGHCAERGRKRPGQRGRRQGRPHYLPPMEGWGGGAGVLPRRKPAAQSLRRSASRRGPIDLAYRRGDL